MPRIVDHELRREQILDATVEVLARVGLDGLSFRQIAKQLGGSTTVVTHYYASQEDLLVGFAARATRRWEAELADIRSRHPDPRDRLRALLLWFIPITEQDVVDERARVQLLSHGRMSHDVLRASYHQWDRMVRDELHGSLAALVSDDEVERTTDLVRVFTGGVAMAVLEYPDVWPIERRYGVVDVLMDLLERPTA